MRAACVIGMACLAAGCYNYRTVLASSPDPGSNIAVTLTDAGSRELARSLGPSVFVVRGRFLSASDTGLLVSVSSVELQRGDELPWAGETVTVPATAVASLETRHLARGRTLLLAGVGAGSLVATTLAFNLLGGGTTPNACTKVPCLPGKQ
jgi:hypothetical protein